MEVPHERGTGATIRLRGDRFELMTRIVGAATPIERARLIGVDRKTIGRVRAGAIRPGHEFMAKTVAALRLHSAALAECGLVPSLDELFEVVIEAVPDVRAA